MTEPVATSESWPASRWWAIVTIVLLVQLTLIAWLGEREARRPAPSSDGLVLQVTGPAARELLGVPDPTLFALPHREGFSGPSWLSMPSLEIQPFAWTEPPRYLQLTLEPVQSLAGLVSTNPLEHPPSSLEFDPELLLSKVDETGLFPAESTLHFTGALRDRPLVTPLILTNWPYNEILSNSVVQLAVDSSGTPVSAILMGPGSGSKQADDYAVRQASRARFAPLNGIADPASPVSELAFGELVFEWHTVASNNPAPQP